MSKERANKKTYNKLVKDIDMELENKRISYAHFSKTLGMPAVTFYNKYKTYGFSVEDLEQFLMLAKSQTPNLIRCLKCGAEFLPKAKSVKRAFCEDCKEEMRNKAQNSDVLRFKYPTWVTCTKNVEIRNLVEQEFHIDEETALAMSEAASVEEAKLIRSERWKSSPRSFSSVIYDTMTEVHF